ncbi:hypothetical protein CLOSTASPAR_02887 [[Clostridium] asparagiforme DSM 15981]|uniref:Uncharacterized protein n=1 Tax=[Clostridium] asparagiforme DSM 15981 TaxID=518636 RepID=C0D0V0_9FIRM|nr:hypothetical protein CLOSTASPAR_02887 [[Clostridium] asparagiforme DSM 15981]
MKTGNLSVENPWQMTKIVNYDYGSPVMERQTCCLPQAEP